MYMVTPMYAKFPILLMHDICSLSIGKLVGLFPPEYSFDSHITHISSNTSSDKQKLAFLLMNFGS